MAPRMICLDRTVPIDSEEAYEIICYPHVSLCNLRDRLEQAVKLGISNFILSGEEKFNVKSKVLGVGHVGVVVKALVGGCTVAVKVRRVDADRESLEGEAKNLEYVNNWGIGPKLYGWSRDFIVMEYVEGERLPEWILKVEDVEYLKEVILEILRQCRLLDSIGVDHGELSRPHRHVLVGGGGRVYILDFESASLRRKPRNVSSISSYLFFKPSRISRILRDKLGFDLREALGNIREYVKRGDDESYQALLRTLNLI